ncbi:MAG: hypothetical protein AB7K35_09845 [Pseudorhodoplanes sp.]
MPALSWIFAVPLFRLLIVNLAIGCAAAGLMVGGLLLLNPHRIRDLILADPSGGATLLLLAFGFVVTFGSTAMGAAIMMLGRHAPPANGSRLPVGAKLAPVALRASAD